MTKKRLKKLEADLRAAVEKRLEQGWALQRRKLLSLDEGCMCLVGCAIPDRTLRKAIGCGFDPTNNLYDAAWRALGVDELEGSSIFSGFDGESYGTNEDPDIQALAARLHDEYCTFEEG